MYYIRMFYPGCLGENEGAKLRIHYILVVTRLLSEIYFHAHCYLINATDDITIINAMDEIYHTVWSLWIYGMLFLFFHIYTYKYKYIYIFVYVH